MASAILVVDTAAVVVVALRVSSRILAPNADRIERWLVELLVGILQVVAVLQVLGALDLLTWLDLFLAQMGLTALVLGLIPAAQPSDRVKPLSPSLGGAFVAGAGVLIGVLAVALSLHGSSLESDTVQYHVVDTGWWLQVHNIWSLPPVDPGYFTNAYPSNGELMGLWLMLPLHSDGLVYMINVLFGLLAVLAGAAAARELGRAHWVGALAALAVVASPLSFWTQTNSLMTDLAASAGIVTGAALLLRGRRDPSRLRWPLMAGLALGFAVGSKDTGLLPAFALVLMGIWLASPARKLRALGSLGLGGALPSLLWFVRNWIELGNPVFPEPVRVFNHEIFAGARSPLTGFATPIFEHLVHANARPLSEWAHLAGQLIGPALAIAAVGVVLGLAVGISRRNRAVLSLACVSLLACLSYSITPYTGGGPAGVTLLISSQLRYALPALLLSAMVASAVLPVVWMVLLCSVSLAYDVAKILQGPGFRHDLNVSTWMVLLALLCGLTVVGWLLARRRAPETEGLLFPRRQLWSWGRRATVVSSVVGVTVAAAGAVIAALPTPVEAAAELAALQHSANPHGPVALAGVADVRALMGPNFDIRIVSIGAGRDHDLPQPSSHAREARLRALGASVVAVGPLLHVFAPSSSSHEAAWVPNGWKLVATQGGVTYYAAPSGAS